MSEPDDLAGELRRHGDWMDASLRPVDPAELRRRAEGGASAPAPLDAIEPPRRSRLPLLAVAAAVLVVLGIVGALLIGTREDDGGQQVDTVVAPVTGSWNAVPDHPFPDPAIVTDVVPAWTGSEVLLVGALSATGVPDDVQGKGMAPLGTIPAFNPAAGSWRTIAAPPIELPGSDLEVAWTGSELLVMGPPPLASGPETAARGAAYDPATDTWRTIAPAPPGRGVGGTGAWAANRMLLWTLGVGVTAYDPAADAWTVLSTEPIGTAGSPMFNSGAGSAVWTGTELVVADGGSSGIAAFEPTSATWRLLPDRPAGSYGVQPLVWTGRVIGSGDRRGPAWMAPGETAWHQPSEPTPEDAGSVPAAQVWVGDRFLSWSGATYGGPSNPRTPAADTAIALDLTTGSWSDAPAPPVVEPPYGDAVLAGDRIFTFSVDNDYQHLVGHGTIRAALSSPGFGIAPLGPARTAPTTDPESADFCASFHSLLVVDAESSPARPSTEDLERAGELDLQADAVLDQMSSIEAQIAADPDAAGVDLLREQALALRQRAIDLRLESTGIKSGMTPEALDRMVADYRQLTEQSPGEIRAAMEVLGVQLERILGGGPMGSGGRPTAEETAATNEIDDWLRSHCGFTMSNPTPVPGSAPDTAPSATTVVGTQVP